MCCYHCELYQCQYKMTDFLHLLLLELAMNRAGPRELYTLLWKLLHVHMHGFSDHRTIYGRLVKIFHHFDLNY